MLNFNKIEKFASISSNSNKIIKNVLFNIKILSIIHEKYNFYIVPLYVLVSYSLVKTFF